VEKMDDNYGRCQKCGALVFSSLKCHKCGGEVKVFCVDIELFTLKQQRDDLLEAVNYLMGDKPSDVIARQLTLTRTKVQRIIAIVAAIAKCEV